MRRPTPLLLAALLATGCGVAGCGTGARGTAAQGAPGGSGQAAQPAGVSRTAPTTAPATTSTTSTTTVPPGSTDASAAPVGAPLRPPAGWRPAGRPVDGHPAVYEDQLTAPGAAAPTGVAWMDTHLLAGRLYSGSKSPGGSGWHYTAPVAPTDALSLVAAFNGGFLLPDSQGGYLSEGRLVAPLRAGAASLVITAGGGVQIGAWGSEVASTPDVVAVRQNLVPLVDGGAPTAAAAGPWRAWGATLCGVHLCSAGGTPSEAQWRSGAGTTADGALVFAAGPALTPLALAQVLVAAGATRGMELDINPNWPVLATYDPPAGEAAAPTDGSNLVAGTQGPATFFNPGWGRDFVTMSARPPA